MRRTKASNPRPGESQEARKETPPGARRFRSRWDLEQDRVIRHLSAAGWLQNRIIGALFEVPVSDFGALLALANQAGPFHLYTDERYGELGL